MTFVYYRQLLFGTMLTNKSRVVRSILLASLFAFLLFKPNLVSAYTWQSVVNVSNDSNSSFFSDIAVDSSGNRHLVWCDRNPSTAVRKLKYATRTPSGSWSSPTDVYTDPNNQDCSNPTLLARSDDSLAVVWEQFQPSAGPHIRFAEKPASGSWSSVTDLNSGSSDDNYGPDLVEDSSGNLHLTWYKAGTQHAYYLTKPASGSWSSESQISSDTGSDPTMTIDGNDTLHFAWQENISGGVNIRYYSKPSSGSWSSGSTVTSCTSPEHCAYAVLSAEGTDVTMTYLFTTNWPTDFDLNVITKSGSGSWSSPTNLTPASGSSAFMYDGGLLMRDGVTHAFWEEETSGNYDVFYAQKVSGTWSTPVNLSNTSLASRFPRFNVGPTSEIAHATWTEDVPGDDPGDIYYLDTVPPNEAPTVDANGPYSVNEGGSVNVSATGSDPESGTLTYAWDLDNNGSYETSGQTVSFSASSLDGPNSYTIGVRVTDPGSLMATDTATVNVANVAPMATFSNTSGTIPEDTAATLAFSSQVDPGAADTFVGFTYSYDCTNDGSYEATDISASTYNCTYGTPGSYTAKGRIKDKDGGNTTYTASVSATDAATVDDFIILGQQGIWLKAGSVVNTGDIGTNSTAGGTYLNAGVETSIGDNVLATHADTDVYGNSVNLRSGSQVRDLYYNSKSGSGTVLGNDVSTLGLPVVSSFPTVPSFSAGTTDVTVAANGSQTISAGSYEDLVVGHDAVVTLSGGTYNFASWDINPDVTINVSAATEIRISGRLKTNNHFILQPGSGSGIDASDIKIFVTGSNGGGAGPSSTPRAADFGDDPTIYANIYANNGTLFLSEGATATGSFLGKWVVAGQNSDLTLDSGF